MTEALCSVSVDFNAITHNYRRLCTMNSMLMPVIKSDAYGHGFLEVADVLREENVQYICVGTVTEAILLRKAGIEATLVPLLGCTNQEEYSLLKKYNITAFVHNPVSLEAACIESNSLAIKIDSGMGRFGFSANDMEKLAKILTKQGVKPSLLISHFSASDTEELDDYTFFQASNMAKAANTLKNTFPDLKTSFGNSATMFAHPELVGDVPRPGISLYGGNPLFGTKRAHLFQGFKQAMSLSTPILSVHSLDKGKSLSYGKSFTAKRDSVVAWIAIGYADGYRRNSAANDENGKGGTQVAIHNTRCPIIGRINMQVTAVDITDLIKKHEVKVGDIAYLLNGCENGIQIEELATWWDTISYDVTTNLGKNLYFFRSC